MKNTDTNHRIRAVVAGGVVAAGLGVGLPFLLDARADESRTPITTPDKQRLPDGQHVGAVTAAYVGPAELVFSPRGASRPVSLPVAGDVVVTTLDGSGSSSELDYDTFTLVVAEADSPAEYRVTLEDGFVVRIEQQS